MNECERDSGFANEKKICSNCGAIVGKDDTYCKKCYYEFSNDKIDDTTVIEGIDNSTVREFVSKNYDYYREKFIRSGDKKFFIQFNLCAFLFGVHWFFYRKMYLPGVLFSLLLITVTLFLLPLSAVVSTFPQEALASTVRLAQYLAQNIEKIGALPLILAALSGVLELVVRIVAGLTGDKLYKKSAVQNIKKIKESDTEDVPVELALARKGGVNPLMGVVGLLAVDFVLELIAAFYTLL